MRTYVEEMVAAWSETFPEDELLVIGYDYVADLRAANVHPVVVPEGAVRRILGQWVGSGLRARRWRADVLVSSSTVVSPLFPRARRLCVVHDWRHLERPEEFGRLQRLYRRTWTLSARWAAHAVQISGKTLRETRVHAPGASAVLVENGRDHARRWSVPAGTVADPLHPTVVTFGHAVNKRADLVVGSLPLAGASARLVVLGARGTQAQELSRLAVASGVSDRVELPGFVPTDDYRSIVSSASVVVLASSDEGFGLPVCEANHFAIPCVVTSDSGLGEIHGSRVVVADPTVASIGAAVRRALDDVPLPVAAESGQTWADCARQLRDLCRRTR